jgi:hypothetical protein
MYQTSIWISALLVTGLAFADEVSDVPRQELLFPTQASINSSLIYVNCEYPIDDKSTDCTILQVLFTKPDTEEKLTAEFVDEFLESIDDDVCTAFRQSSPAAAWDDPDIQARLEGRTPAEIDQGKKFFHICVERDLNNRRVLLRRLFEQFNDEQRKRCSPTFLPGSRRFTWDSAAKQWRSVNDSGGSCGSANVTTLKSDDGTWWSYSSQTIISNPEARESITGTSCSEWADASPLVWRSKGNAIQMNCQIIGNSWNK